MFALQHPANVVCKYRCNRHSVDTDANIAYANSAGSRFINRHHNPLAITFRLLKNDANIRLQRHSLRRRPWPFFTSHR
jgi:hypothetical protein